MQIYYWFIDWLKHIQIQICKYTIGLLIDLRIFKYTNVNILIIY